MREISTNFDLLGYLQGQEYVWLGESLRQNLLHGIHRLSTPKMCVLVVVAKHENPIPGTRNEFKI